MSTLILYHFPMSGPSRGALLAARSIEIPVEVKIVDLFKKEQLQEDFKKLNPQHCVPTLDDNGFILWESRAISRYLVNKYNKNDQLYPEDLKKRAIVDSRLDFDSSSLYVKIRAICFPILFKGVTEIKQELKDDLNTVLGFLNGFLKNSTWVAGENATIADFAIYASMSSILAVGWDISAFANIQRWLNQCSSLPGNEENLEGAKKFGEAVNMKLK